MLIIIFGSHQNNESGLFGSHDGCVSHDSSQDIWKFDCIIRVFRLFGAWVMHRHTLQK